MAGFSARVEVDGASLSRLDTKLHDFPDELVYEILKAQQANALDMRSVAIEEVQRGERSGRIYRRKKGKIVHKASAPGEPPKSDSGNLVAHIRGFVEDRVTAVLEAATAYAKALEFGTRKMAARPFMDRAAAIVLKRAIVRLSNAIRAAAKTIAGK